MLDGYSTSCCQDKSKDSKDLVLDRTHRRHQSYIHKILDGDKLDTSNVNFCHSTHVISSVQVDTASQVA